ncbi:hypothetical protein PU560_09550, partial [Georgenia sp. 10Sc9-8]|nr:hypothetical protein [Georgenia halotolerans]
PYGGALPWPGSDGAHRPGRKAGAVVVLVDGALVLYVERGGATLLSFTADAVELRAAATALADTVRAGVLGRLTVRRADGRPVLGPPTALTGALEEAGFLTTPQGMRVRATAPVR